MSQKTSISSEWIDAVDRFLDRKIELSELGQRASELNIPQSELDVAGELRAINDLLFLHSDSFPCRDRFEGKKQVGLKSENVIEVKPVASKLIELAQEHFDLDEICRRGEAESFQGGDDTVEKLRLYAAGKADSFKFDSKGEDVGSDLQAALLGIGRALKDDALWRVLLVIPEFSVAVRRLLLEWSRLADVAVPLLLDERATSTIDVRVLSAGGARTRAIKPVYDALGYPVCGQPLCDLNEPWRYFVADRYFCLYMRLRSDWAVGIHGSSERVIHALRRDFLRKWRIRTPIS